MNLLVRIPDELAARVDGIDPARLEQAALEAVARVAEEQATAVRTVAGVTSKLTPQEAIARMRADRPGNVLPPGVTIRDLMTYGRD